MTKQEIINMLITMHDMTRLACEGTKFTEISTYVKNHCKNIDPEYIEVFRDFIIPLCKKEEIDNKSMPNYLLIGNKLFQKIISWDTGELKHPNNLYVFRRSNNGAISLDWDIFTYEELVSKGAKPPYDDNELLKAIH